MAGERTLVRIDELTQRHWDGQVAVTDGVGEGFNALPWTALDLDALVPDWEALARGAASPNPFFEPWFLIPSLRQFDPEGAVHFAMLVREGRLVALMPSWLDREYHGHRLPHLATWLHTNAFCGVPLIVSGHEEDFWRAFLAWADVNAGLGLFFQLPNMPEETHACSALRTVCAEDGRSCHVVHREKRALLRRGLSPEVHLRQAVAKKQRKELHRKQRRLAEAGVLVISRQCDAAEIDEWIDDFLALEQGGWKGRDGSALACDPRTAALFREALTGAANAGRLDRLAILLDGHPVAMLCTFVCSPGSFGFKTTFDESYSGLSPGVLLQIENLALLERGEIDWSDSCAAAEHPMIDKIWRDRRDIVWLSVAIGGRLRRWIGATLSAFEARRSEKRA